MILKVPFKKNHSLSEFNTFISTDLQWSVFESGCNMHTPNEFIKANVIIVNVT